MNKEGDGIPATQTLMFRLPDESSLYAIGQYWPDAGDGDTINITSHLLDGELLPDLKEGDLELLSLAPEGGNGSKLLLVQISTRVSTGLLFMHEKDDRYCIVGDCGIEFPGTKKIVIPIIRSGTPYGITVRSKPVNLELPGFDDDGDLLFPDTSDWDWDTVKSEQVPYKGKCYSCLECASKGVNYVLQCNKGPLFVEDEAGNLYPSDETLDFLDSSPVPRKLPDLYKKKSLKQPM